MTRTRKPQLTARNNERANTALEVVEWYAANHGEPLVLFAQVSDGILQNIVDVLAEMMHLCQREGLDFDSAERMARAHYTAERKQ
jgi:hypothetical protein